MAHGGARPGAGRKPGAIRKATAAAQAKAAQGGILPLDYMLQIMRDEGSTKAERMDMAKAAAPYVHAKLSSVEAKVDAEVGGLLAVEWRIVDPVARSA
jgi:hypothetical protein